MQAENRQADIAVDRETLEKTFKHIDISRLSGETVERAKKVKFLVLDIDGVCTNGQLYINPRGETTKTFHVHDGIGIKTAFMAGIGVGIITGRQDKNRVHGGYRHRHHHGSERHVRRSPHASLRGDGIFLRVLQQTGTTCGARPKPADFLRGNGVFGR